MMRSDVGRNLIKSMKKKLESHSYRIHLKVLHTEPSFFKLFLLLPPTMTAYMEKKLQGDHYFLVCILWRAIESKTT